MIAGLAIKSTIVLITAWLAAMAMRRASAAQRHLVWTAAFAAIAILPAAIRFAPAWETPLPIGATFSAAAIVPTTTQAMNLAFWLWLAVSSLLLLRLAASHWRMHRLVQSSRPLADGILESDLAITPMAWGFLNPVIVLPAGLPDPDRRIAIAHEKAHIRRHDCLAQLFRSLVCCFYWPHPLAWLAARQATEESERACDDAVLAQGELSTDYAARLVDAARRLTPAPAAAVAMVRQSHLERRVRALLDLRLNRKSAGRRHLFAVAAIALAVLAPLAALRAQEDKVERIGGDVTSPKLIHKVEPNYTPDAKDAGVEGTVVLYVEVTSKGLPRNLRVLESLHPGLDEQAKIAIDQWRFEPGTKQGKPVAVAATIEVNFRLK